MHFTSQDARRGAAISGYALVILAEIMTIKMHVS